MFPSVHSTFTRLFHDEKGCLNINLTSFFAHKNSEKKDKNIEFNTYCSEKTTTLSHNFTNIMKLCYKAITRI